MATPMSMDRRLQAPAERLRLPAADRLLLRLSVRLAWLAPRRSWFPAPAMMRKRTLQSRAVSPHLIREQVARHLDLAAVPRMVPALVQRRERLDKVRRRAITPVPGAAMQGIRPLAVLLPEVLHRIILAKRRVDQRVRRRRRALLAKA